MTTEPDLTEALERTFLLELARELILQSNATIDETRFAEAVEAGKDNWVDIAILYDMIELARNMSMEGK